MRKQASFQSEISHFKADDVEVVVTYGKRKVELACQGKMAQTVARSSSGGGRALHD